MEKISVTILLLLLLPLAACVDAQTETPSISEFVGDFAAALYENTDLGTTHNLSPYIQGDSLAIYLSEKVAIHQLVTEKAHLHKTNYKLEVEPMKTIALDAQTHFISLVIRVSFSYVGLGETESGYGETLDMIIAERNGRYTVLDIFAHNNYYDTELRGNIQLRTVWQGEQGLQFLEKSEIANRAKELKLRLEAYYN